MENAKSLAEIFNKNRSDKSSKHKYDRVYERDFEVLRSSSISILEIGILNGDSLASWIDYFPNATVYGVDTFERVAPDRIGILRHERVRWLKADSTAPETKRIVQESFPGAAFDIIIDDGLHTPRANQLTFQNFFPLLKDSGVYYVEDVWPLDVMTPEQWQHPWIRHYSADYTADKMNSFNKEIGSYLVDRYDLRAQSGHPDSYIVRVRRPSK